MSAAVTGGAASALLRHRVLCSYLRLRRATVRLFSRDDQALAASRERTRSEFLKHRDVRDPAQIERLLQQAAEASEFIRKSIVQAELTSRGTWRASLPSLCGD